MSHNPSVFEMLHQVLADSRSKLEKTAEAASGEGGEKKKKEEEKKPSPEKQEAQLEEYEKVAEACDWLAANLGQVVDDRGPEEKLAEYAAIHEEFMKMAEDLPSEIPMDPPLDSGGKNPGGPNSAMVAEQTNTPGQSLQPGESGSATPLHQSPKTTVPSESPNPADSNNAMETNKDMLQSEYPEDLLKQSRALGVLKKLGGSVPPELKENAKKVKAVQDPDEPGAEVPSELKEKAATFTAHMHQAGYVPTSIARTMLSKLAEDAVDPAKIDQKPHTVGEGGTRPVLQKIPGTNPAQMQGSEAGEQTPRETAPLSGEGVGRLLVGSNQAAIDATKGQAKGQVKSPLGEILTEPAMSAAHDNVLQRSLDHTPETGVKIAAQRELLKKLAASSPQVKRRMDVLIKMAQGEEVTPNEQALVGGGAASPEEAIAAQAIAEAAAEGAAQQELEAEKASQAAGAPPTGGPAAAPPMMGGGPPVGAPPAGPMPAGGVPAGGAPAGGMGAQAAPPPMAQQAPPPGQPV